MKRCNGSEKKGQWLKVPFVSVAALHNQSSVTERHKLRGGVCLSGFRCCMLLRAFTGFERKNHAEMTQIREKKRYLWQN